MKKTAQNNAGSNSKKTEGINDWLKNVNPGNVLNDAQKILSTAIDVLEEEIAAGILAAKQLEKKVIDVDEVRSASPEDLMSRIRRDAHDGVDLMLDALTALTHYVGDLTKSANGVNGQEPKSTRSTGIPVVQNDVPAKPGDTIEIAMLVTNHSADKTMKAALSKTELTGPVGTKISARSIQVVPASVTLAPAESIEIVIKIKIPATTKAGSYSGLFQDENNPQLQTVVTVEIM